MTYMYMKFYVCSHDGSSFISIRWKQIFWSIIFFVIFYYMQKVPWKVMVARVIYLMKVHQHL